MIFLRPAFRTGGVLCAAILTPKSADSTSAEPVPPPVDEEKAKKWDRVYKIFTVDEYGSISPELNTVYQTTFFTTFIGACYGGFIQSRDAYLKFIERNQASQFVDHFEAKKKLQDHVTINFAKGALRWSWRLALFSGLYVTFVTVLSAYRGRPSIFDYTLGGLLSGSIYQMNMGLRGVIVGGTLGAMIGLFAGSLSLTVMRFSGITMDDLHQWQYELSQKRKRHLDEAVAKHESRNIDTTLLTHHESLINKNNK